MIDSGRNETDRKLEELEKEIHGIYAQANKELQEKMTEYFRKFKKRDEEKQKQLENGEITAEEYRRWRMGQMATGSRWKSMCDVIAKDMHNSNAIARSVTQGHMAEIYAINHNWTTYDIENKAMLNTNYAMYNSDVVENLLKENPDILPLLRDSDGNIVREKDIAWNKKVINAVMLQGILQGESIDKMAKRFEEVGVRNEKASVRYARTATTGAENAGRIDGYRRAQKLGIHVIKVWLATLDGRTRDSHRALDGEEQEVEKEFSNGCMHPGDPNCPDPSEVWNCRCTLITKVDGQNYDVSKVKRDSKLGDMSYDEWKENRDVEKLKPTKNPAEVNADGTFKNLPIAGVNIGKPMTFEEADSYHTNPNYGGRGYATNCQTCVAAFEARLRGYKVIAKANYNNAYIKLLSSNTNEIWIDPKTGFHPKYIYDNSANTPEKCYNYINGIVREGERYTLQFSWKGRMSAGHIVNLDRNENGEIRLHDNQRGKGEVAEHVGEEAVTKYLSKIKYHKIGLKGRIPCVPKLLRIDNVDFDYNYASQIMEAEK